METSTPLRRVRISRVSAVLLEEVAHDAFAARQIDKVVSKPMRPRVESPLPPRRVLVVVHVGDLTFAIGQILQDIAQFIGGGFDVEISTGSSTLPCRPCGK